MQNGWVGPRFSVWLASAGVAISSGAVFVAWLDRPIALSVHSIFGSFPMLGSFTGTPSFFGPLAIAVFLIFAARRLAFRPFAKLDAALIQGEVGIMLAKPVVAVLKFASGRTWPQYNHPSLIDDGVYGFNFFHGGAAFDSFPSGHMASTCALIAAFWICFPQFARLYGILITLMALGLIAGNYHFVSDVIAGAFIGGSIAVFTASIWQASQERLSPIAATKDGNSTASQLSRQSTR
jgi:membrane-associated phospholipid phosphatase